MGEMSEEKTNIIALVSLPSSQVVRDLVSTSFDDDMTSTKRDTFAASHTLTLRVEPNGRRLIRVDD